MSAPNFTPGPWVAHPSTRYRGDLGYAWDIATGAATWDASDYDRHGGTRGVWQFPDGYSRVATTSDGGPTAQADAQLCAAAPELYAALEAIIQLAEFALWEQSPPLADEHLLKAALAALAKARGEAS